MRCASSRLIRREGFVLKAGAYGNRVRPMREERCHQWRNELVRICNGYSHGIARTSAAPAATRRAADFRIGIACETQPVILDGLHDRCVASVAGHGLPGDGVSPTLPRCVLQGEFGEIEEGEIDDGEHEEEKMMAERRTPPKSGRSLSVARGSIFENDFITPPPSSRLRGGPWRLPRSMVASVATFCEFPVQPQAAVPLRAATGKYESPRGMAGFPGRRSRPHHGLLNPR